MAEEFSKSGMFQERVAEVCVMSVTVISEGGRGAV